MTKTEYWNLVESETEENLNKVRELFKLTHIYGGASDGYGYKADIDSFKDVDLDEIVYIPEHGYEYLNNGEIDVWNLDVYTVQDFVDYFEGDLEDGFVLFCTVGWQSPETLVHEEYMYGEIRYCEKCKRHFYDYHNKNCKVCGTRYENADNDY